MKEIEILQKRIELEERLKDYKGADRVVLAEEKKQEIEEQRALRPHFVAKTSIPTLDACTEGFRKGQLIVLSGPPKQGKTSLCQTFTKKFDENNQKCIWFSYEMGYEELFQKFPMENLTFYVPAYMESGNVEWVEERIIEAKKKFGVDIVFIDHLDFLRDPNVLKGISLNLSSYVGGIVQKVKSMAVKHNVIIFLMSHIRKNKWTSKDLPSSEELRDTGQTAQLADIVLMIMRKRAKESNEIYEGNLCILGVMENRHNGRTKKMQLVFNNNEFTEYAGEFGNFMVRTDSDWG